MKASFANASTGLAANGQLRIGIKRKRAVLALAATAATALAFSAPAALAQLTITTGNGGVTGSVLSNPDFGNTNIIGWEDYSNQDRTASPLHGGPGQSFLPTTNFTLNSITIKGGGGAGENGGSLANPWTVTIGEIPGGVNSYGAAATILDTESGAGTAINTDVNNGVTTNYDQFTLQNPVSVTAGTLYFFAVSSGTYGGSGAYYGFAKSTAADATANVGILALANSATAPIVNYQQGFDYTYFINGTLASVSDNNAIWAKNGTGNWSTSSADNVNWASSSPPATSNSSATFGTDGGVITVTPTVNVVGTQLIKTVNFSSAAGYNLTNGTVSVTSTINSTAGANTITNLTVANGATFNISPGSSVTSTNFSHAQYDQVNIAGGGVLNINSTNNGNLELTGGSTLNITGTGIAAGAAFIYDIGVATAADQINLGTNNYFDSNSLSGGGTIILGSGTTLVSDESNAFQFSGSLSGTGAVVLGSVGGSAGYAGNVGYNALFTGTSPSFSGPISATYLSVLQVGAGATLGNGSATNIVTLDSGTLQATGITTLSNPISLVDTQSLTTGSDTIDTQTNTLTLTGSISGAEGLLKAGSGTLVLGPSNTYSGPTNVSAGTLVLGAAKGLPNGNALTIGSGATVQLAAGTGVETVSSVTFADSTGTLDIANNHMFIADNAGVAATIISKLQEGHASSWAGPGGIISSVAALLPKVYGVAFGEGSKITGIASGQIEISYTLYGDINQDGSVNGTDFGILAANFGKSVTGGWEQGDLNYDGAVTGADFALLAANFGKSATGRAIDLPASEWASLDSFAASNGLLADVPEPASVGVIALVGAGALSRRRRR